MTVKFPALKQVTTLAGLALMKRRMEIVLVECAGRVPVRTSGDGIAVTRSPEASDALPWLMLRYSSRLRPKGDPKIVPLSSQGAVTVMG